MTLESKFTQCAEQVDFTPAADVAAGQILQLADGRAAIATTLLPAGKLGAVATEGRFKVAKTASVVLLAGGKLFWDYSANTATFKPVNDRDFYLGTVAVDAASADTEVYVDLNEHQRNVLDALAGRSLTVPVGTQALGGCGLSVLGGSRGLTLDATSEAQKVDILSVDRVDPTANPIFECVIRPSANGSGAAVDFNVGLANGTHATDADSITEYAFFHIDGGSTAIKAQSTDGTTTVAATDTTKVISAGTAVANQVEFWIDARDLTNVKLYIDGVQVLSGTTFKLDHATGPLGVLAHVEKTTGTTTAAFIIDRLVARIMEQ